MSYNFHRPAGAAKHPLAGDAHARPAGVAAVEAVVVADGVGWLAGYQVAVCGHVLTSLLAMYPALYKGIARLEGGI